MVYFFSGTGNSAYVAGKIAEAAGDELTDLNALIRKEYSTGDASPLEHLVFCVPTYAWRIPNVVRDWIRSQSFAPGAKIWFVMTCGGEIGDAATTNKALCDEKGLTYMGTASVLMPENYIAMFSAPGREEAERIVGKAAPAIEAAIGCIKEDRPFPKPRANFYDRAMSRYVNPLFYRFFIADRAFTAGDACNSCGVCEKNCPLGNIEIVDGKPRWKGNCTHCMACITLCPQKTIEYGKASRGKPRYRCPM